MGTVKSVLLPTVLVAAIVVGVCAAIGGREALWGALVGAALVLLFLGSSPSLLTSMMKEASAASMAIALGFFTVKAVVAFIVVLLLLDPDGIGKHLQPQAVAVAMVVTALTWVGASVLAFKRARTPIYDLE